MGRLFSKSEQDGDVLATSADELDRLDARKWSWSKKVVTTWVVSLFKFISGVTSTSVVPHLGAIALQFGVHSSFLKTLPLSVYFIGYTLGLLMIGPLSETFGRVGMLQLSNILFIVFNTAAGFSQTTTQIIVMRILCGFGAAGPLSLGSGILSDCFTPEERTTMIIVYALPAQLSPAIGPILGAVCERYLDWRWTFWIVSIISVVLQGLCFLTVHETYKPALERRFQRAQRNKDLHLSFLTQIGELFQDVWKRLRANMFRPVKMLITHPIVQLLALYNGVTYGTQFLLISSMDGLWTGPYKQPVILASLNYLALGVGLIVGAQVSRPLNLAIGRRLRARDAEKKSRPEHRIPMIAAGSVVAPIGLLWYGWSSQYLTFPLVPDMGIFVFAMGSCVILNITSLYLVDTYKQQSASATGAVNILRALSGFVGTGEAQNFPFEPVSKPLAPQIFPLFASKMYDELGQGVGNTILAAASIGLGWPIPLLLWRYGRGIREKQVDL